MVFLNPSILLGLLAASIPILIHILNFRKLQKVEFSTLAFLKELQKSKIRKIKIKQWLLLILRTLIIILLVLAFARPTLETTTFAGSTAAAKSSSVFIVDHSFSMSYVENKGSLFNIAKSAAREMITLKQDGDEFIFLLKSDSVISVSNRESAFNILNDLEITLAAEPTLKMLQKAISVLKESQNINKEIYLFSDFQNSTFSFNEIEDSAKTLNRGNDIRLYAFDISAADPVNYAVSDLSLQNAIIELNKPLIFTARIFNYSSNILNDARISLFLNGKRVAQENISVPGREEKMVRFETSLTEEGLNEAYVQLEDDEIIQDNKSFVNFFVPPTIDILLLYDKEEEIFFIESALKSSSVSERLKISKAKTDNILNLPLSEAEFIIMAANDLNSAIDLRSYISNGGNFLFIPEEKIVLDQLISLQSIIGLPEAEKIISSDRDQLNYVEFGKVDFGHPLFVNLFSENAKTEIESPLIFKYIKFSNSPKIKSIISLFDDSVFLGEYSFGKGKVMFFNIAFNLQWSNFPIKGIFAPLMSAISSYLSTSKTLSNTYFTGDKISIDIKNATFPLIDVVLPEGKDKIRIEDFNERRILYSNTDKSGSYKFFNNGRLIDFAAVNTDLLESDLIKENMENAGQTFEEIFGDNYIIFNNDENYLEQISQARYGTELWSYFLIAALLLALLEMYLSRSTKKDIISVDR
jgi:hypothetical protein